MYASSSVANISSWQIKKHSFFDGCLEESEFSMNSLAICVKVLSGRNKTRLSGRSEYDKKSFLLRICYHSMHLQMSEHEMPAW